MAILLDLEFRAVWELGFGDGELCWPLSIPIAGLKLSFVENRVSHLFFLTAFLLTSAPHNHIYLGLILPI